MSADCTNNCIALEAGGMDLAATLECGQSFSWLRDAHGGYTGVAGGRAVRAAQRGGTLYITRLDGCPPTAEDADFWRRYFALDVDYSALLAAYAADDTLAACVAHRPGIRVLRQPFFETLLAFIISQNNNIPRITGIVGRLRQGFGPQLAAGVHGFPRAEALAGLAPEDLAPLRAGFRAKYLIDAAQKVAAGAVSQAALDALDDDGARALLCTIKGVGPKVADCVLLFALGRWNVAPMDVWMKRAMARCFPGGMPPCAAGSAGIAQQFIFHWARAHLAGGQTRE